MPVFAHSFEHSMLSALASNGVEAVLVTVTSSASEVERDQANKAEKFAPDAKLRITVKPLHRTRFDGYQAIVGTLYEANLIDSKTEKTTWHTEGKVDYIRMFGRRYTASPGIRKEFAWSTTAAIVRKFTAEVNGQKPEPIYTDTEARESHGERVD